MIPVSSRNHVKCKMAAILFLCLKVDQWTEWLSVSRWSFGRPCFGDLLSGWTTKTKIYSHWSFFNSNFSKSYFQWGGGSSKEDVPLWPPSGILWQTVRIGLIRQKIRRVCRNYNDIQTRPGRPVPLSELPHPDTMKPHRRLDGVSPNLFASLTQSLTAAFSHRCYADIQNNEASFPLHAGSDQPIRNLIISEISSLYDKSIWLQVARNN